MTGQEANLPEWRVESLCVCPSRKGETERLLHRGLPSVWEAVRWTILVFCHPHGPNANPAKHVGSAAHRKSIMDAATTRLTHPF